MPESYPYIRVWGTILGELPFYIEQTQQRAAREQQPVTVIGRSSMDPLAPDEAWQWQTVDCLTAYERIIFGRACESLGVESPWKDQPF